MRVPENVGGGDGGTGAEPIIKSGSDPVSFDELETVMDTPKHRPSSKGEKGETKKESGGKSTPKTKGKADANDDRESDDEGEESDDEESESEVEEENSEKDGKKPEKVKDKGSSPKEIKVRNGDKDVALRPDSQIDVVVNGKKESVSLQKVIAEYSGKVNLGREYQKLGDEKKTFDAEKKSLQSEREDIRAGIDKYIGLANSNDPLSAFDYLADVIGTDAAELIGKFQGAIEAQIDATSKLTPEERDRKKIESERDLYKRKVERTQADQTKQAEKSALEKTIQAVKTQHKIDDATFQSRYQEIAQLKASGAFKEAITPELVGNYHREMVRRETVSQVLKEVNPTLDTVTRGEAYQSLRAQWDANPDMSKSDLIEIATEVFGQKAARNLARKIKKSGGSPTEAVATHRKLEDEPWSFDQLE